MPYTKFSYTSKSDFRHVIFHVPHSSVDIPEIVRDQFVLDDQSLANELIKMTDRWTYELISGYGPSSAIINSPVSRLVVDVERFYDDSQEIMATIGMGVIYTATHSLGALRRPISAAERKFILDAWYHPHHKKLTDAVEIALEQYGKALIFDIHSYPEQALPYEINGDGKRPEICIGTDDFHTSERLTKIACSAFESIGFEVGLNSPFKGSLVPAKYYCKDPRVYSLMIEIRRDLYMNEESGLPLSDFLVFSNKLKKAIFEITDQF